MPKLTLTVGYTTYMRRSAILDRLSKLLADPLAADLAIIVIDDASTDGTFEALTETFRSDRLRILTNDHNLGQARTICRIVSECQSDYLVLMSDEDEVRTDSLRRLEALLESTSPSFASPQMWFEGALYRGRPQVGSISARDFFSSSFYVSGLVLDVQIAKSIAQKLAEMAPTNAAVWLYPQTALAIGLMLQSPAIWLDIQLTQKSEQLPSLIKDTDGSAYQYLESRWRQHLAWLRYFDEFAEQSTVSRSSLEQMRHSLQSNLYDRLLEAMEKESPESAKAFRKAAGQREGQDMTTIRELETKLDNFRGMIHRRDEKIAKLKSKLKSKP